jgi:hypothetical protein
MMNVISLDFEAACQVALDRFFAAHPDVTMHKRTIRTLRMLRASERPLKGKVEGWAAGIIYAVATDARIPCGVPGVLNAEFVELMGVSMETARYRAARVRELVMW